MVIEEARQTFLTGCVGRAVKHSQQPVCAALGPLGVRSCQCQAIPGVGGMTTRRSNVSSLMSLPARFIFFQPRREVFFGSSSFRGMYHQGSPFLWRKMFFGILALFARSECKGHFSKCFAFYSKPLNRSLEVFWAGHLTWLPAPRGNLLAMFDAILLFELWILIPRIIPLGPAAPFYLSRCGFRSLELFSIRPTMSSCCSSCGLRSLESLFFGLQRR
jgi:hypothetical protein